MLSAASRNPGDRVLFYSFLVLLVWLPLPLGSNRVWAWSIMEVWVLVLALAWLVQYARGRVQFSPAFLRAWPVMVCLVLVCLWVQLQTVVLPADLLQILSPAAYEIHTATNTDLTISLNVYATRVSVLQSTTYLLIFCLTLLLLNDKPRVQLLALVLVISGVFQAAYGSLMMLSGIEYGFFFEKEAYRGFATGTFVNRNHLAGYLEMCLAVGIGLMVAQLSDRSASNWRDRARRFLQTMLSTKALIRLGLVVMVIGLVLTRSRMGNTAFFASMLIVGIFYIVFIRRMTRGTIIFFVSLLLIDLLVVGNFFGIEQVAERLQQTSVDSEGRDEVARDTLEIVKDYPLAGTGAGSFFSVYPMYDSGNIGFGFYKHAHNDYLEFASNLGLIAFGLLGFCVLVSLFQAIRAQLARRDRLAQGMGFAATMAIVALLIHSSVDFNLQIPANAATFMVVLALAWVSRYANPGA
jgi:putative inorganic carbon (HCO3(-)) transporter